MMKEESKKWWEQANRDLESAEKIMKIEDYRVSAFLAQQAVEKALKALLIGRTGAFPRIHDVAGLSRLAGAPPRIIGLCAAVNPAYTATRYPDVALGSDFGKDDVKEILKSAKEVLEWIRKELKS